MFSNIGSLLDKLQGLLSKGFLLGGLVPFILLFFINWGLVLYIYPNIYAHWSSIILPPKQENSLYWVKTLTILFVGSLIIWNINPWLRQFWEGSYLPNSVRLLLSNEYSKQFRELTEERKSIANKLNSYRELHEVLENELSSAREKGASKPSGSISTKLAQDYNSLKAMNSSFGLIPIDDIKNVYELLKAELENKPADGSKLDQIHIDFVQLFQESLSYYEYTYDRLQSNIRQRFPNDIGRIGPTTMSNFAEAHRDYGLVRYGMDIERFWMHLLKIIRGDTDFYPMLEEAKIQLDFSIAITSVFAITTAIWIPISWWAISTWPFVLVILLGPIIVSISYKIAIQSYRRFTEVVRSAIDLNRFKLLDLLHISTPDSSHTEREIWRSFLEERPSFIYSAPVAKPALEENVPSFKVRLKKWFGFK
ncbi:hypothetical protein QNI16_24040 [Cytophagaceae bacterium YF14B1]|uniref:Uncharacterized protein n=1 Tax=Xanthocytophaga flava TaxID=3048013 RepID=A0AAE3QRH6_9BACT|nr:hypothetical protein [Xanthocytophaga flavus]MDJ1483591.1 hypothetical protein [Xanthocytophaga flavus]